MEPSFLFKAAPPNGEPAPPAEPLPPQAPRCHVVIRALCGEQPMCWEVGIGLEELWGAGDGSQPEPFAMKEAAWDQALHRLTAASVVQDNEQLALRGRAETMAEQGMCLADKPQTQRLQTENGEGTYLCVKSACSFLCHKGFEVTHHTDKVRNLAE